jgi:uncharacterized membrane protein
MRGRRSIIARMSEPGSVLLDAVLRPAPPLPPRALAIVLGIVAAMNALFALYFVLHGAWPVMPFMGLDVVLLAWAFRAVSREARREEHIVLTPSRLSIARRPPAGPVDETILNPYWVRVAMDDPPSHASQLTLWNHGKGVRIGTFLPPAERASFAQRLKGALREARSAVIN